jgi:amidase
MRVQPRSVRIPSLLLALALIAPQSAGAQAVGLAEATIEDLGRAFASGSLTAERLIEMHLARIEAYDQAGPALNAVLHVNPEALEIARALDRERQERGAALAPPRHPGRVEGQHRHP